MEKKLLATASMIIGVFGVWVGTVTVGEVIAIFLLASIYVEVGN